MKIKKRILPDDFWVEVLTRNLDTCGEGEGGLDTTEDIHYISYQGARECQDNYIDLTKLFYTLLKKHKELERKGDLFVFDIKAYHHSLFNFNDDNDGISRNEEEWDKVYGREK